MYSIFFVKNAIVILILFAVGLGDWTFIDSNKKTYNHEIIVTQEAQLFVLKN
jgi:hypothetical protein